MAECKTCGATIEVPEGWSIGPAVRRHYWEAHPERMQRTRADKQAEEKLPGKGNKAVAPNQPDGTGL